MANEEPAVKLAVDSGFSVEETAFALKYLKAFGYIEDAHVESVPDAIKDFQSSFSLDQTGALDRDTLRHMALPRCGVSDHLQLAEEAKWGRNALTYYVANYTSGLSSNDQDTLLQLAFDQWALVCNLTFTRVNSTNQANIIVGSGKGRQYGFDGPFGTLAWANLPQGNNQQLQLMFDMEETWVKALNQGQRGILYLNVATHEIGHIIGLDHSSQRSALMYPIYDPNVPRPQQNDDIPRSRALYGAPIAPPPPTGGGGNEKETVIRVIGGSITIDGRLVPNNFGVMV